MGLTNGLDSLVYQYLGVCSSQPILILTYTASVYSFIIYIVIFLSYDLIRFRKIGLTTSSLLLSLIITEATALLLKATIQSPRPGEKVTHEGLLKAIHHYDTYSFPSGHSSRAAVLSFYLSKYRNLLIKVLSWTWFIGISLSRLLLGAHWLSDVLESLFIGISISLGVDYTVLYWVSYYNRLVSKAKPLTIRVKD